MTKQKKNRPTLQDLIAILLLDLGKRRLGKDFVVSEEKLRQSFLKIAKATAEAARVEKRKKAEAKK